MKIKFFSCALLYSLFFIDLIRSDLINVKLTTEDFIIAKGPENMGIGMGHSSINGNWYRFLERLGVNSARLFVSSTSDLRNFIGSVNWGQNLDGFLVTNYSMFLSSISKLRTLDGRNDAYQWKNPIKWKTINDSFSKVSSKIYGSDENTINTLNSINIGTLLVEHIGCSSASTKFQFLSMDPSTPEYWQERWELYKHSYAMAVWARNKDVKMIEFYNEPDFDLGGCLDSAKFKDYYYIRSLSIQNAYEDSNLFDKSKNVAVKVVASAFARRNYGGDQTRYLGDVVVDNRNIAFGTNTKNINWNNMHLFSIHSYGKIGSDLYDDFQYLTESVKNATDYKYQIPVIITEHNTYTSSTWDTLNSTADGPAEASRLASQIAYLALGNITSHYVFKFSITPSFSATRDIAKNGLHWGEIYLDPYDLADTTLSAESMRILTQLKQSNIYKVTSNDTSKYRTYLSTRDENNYYIFIVNDKKDIVNLAIDFSKLNIADESKIIVEKVSSGYFSEITSISNGPKLGTQFSLTIPEYSTTKLTLRKKLVTTVSFKALLSCSAFAGSLSDLTFCSDSSNYIGTSNTIQHENTSVTLVKFQVNSNYINQSFILKMHIKESFGTEDNRMVVLGIKNVLKDWNEISSSWNSLSNINSGLNILKTTPSGTLIDSVSKNFINWPSDSNLAVVGHITVKKLIKDTYSLIDVTDYVRSVQKLQNNPYVTFLIYRPFRNPSYQTSAGAIPADNLCNGGITKFSSYNSLNSPELLII